MANLVTLADLKTYMGVTSDDRDAYLSGLIKRYSAVVETWIGRTLASASYTEYYAGTGTVILNTVHYPITAITSIYEDNAAYYGQATDAFSSTSLLTAGTDYAPVRDPDQVYDAIVRIGSFWPKLSWRVGGFISDVPLGSFGNIKVVYTAGYATIPYDIQEATMKWIIKVNATRNSGGIFESERWEDYQYTQFNEGRGNEHTPIPKDIMVMLSAYRRPVIG